MADRNSIISDARVIARSEYCRELGELSPQELHEAVSRAVMGSISENWNRSRKAHGESRRAFYLSAEFLVGRAVYNNLMCLGLTDELEQQLEREGVSLSAFEEIEDAALGNGGLGRLAACFLDSAATLDLPLDGYGIRYRYGLFRQSIEDGFQKETADDWERYGDPWSVRRDSEAVNITFRDMTVRAVPYDMPIIGYKTDHISTLRLWQSEPLEEFDFTGFNNCDYDEAVSAKNRAEDISRVLYPNDEGWEGKKLRLRQQYFFSSAAMQDILRRYTAKHGEDFSAFADEITVQLNDTHPVISVPELIRLLTTEHGLSFENALAIAKKTFNYTNHTVMPEALEKWDVKLMDEILPEISKLIRRIDDCLRTELPASGVSRAATGRVRILRRAPWGAWQFHMANLAVFCSAYVNGVAEIHTEILKTATLRDWYGIYPERFQNKTNGITPRRWLALCNPGLSDFITELLGGDEWMTEPERLRGLERFADDAAVLRRFTDIKTDNKKRLAAYIQQHDGVTVDPNTIFDIQIKRLHEYKRQFLNALTILALYYMIKDGELTDFEPTTFIFGAKSAPGYKRAKGIIKLINEIARLVDSDPEVSRYIKVVFVSNYNVSYAEKLIPAADVSEQISTAGTEASGTGNMKLMLSGAVTLGTYDGANIEIVEEAGEDNNYIFGARVEEIESLKKANAKLKAEGKKPTAYNPAAIYRRDALIKRCLDAMTDGTLSDGGTGMFKELKDSIIKGASWHDPDHYFLLLDFRSYLDARIRLNREYRDREAFTRKCWMNVAGAGKFSSDRTIRQYADELWHIEPVKL